MKCGEFILSKQHLSHCKLRHVFQDYLQVFPLLTCSPDNSKDKQYARQPVYRAECSSNDSTFYLQAIK